MSTKKIKLLPEISYHPIMLILLCALPQLILLALHFNAFELVRGELSGTGRGAHLAIFVFLGACCAAWLLLGSIMIRMKRQVGALIALIVFLVGFGYLWMVMQLLPDLIPSSVGNWMLAPEELAYNHMALIAPSLFYGLVLLAGIPLGKARGADIAVSIATVVAIPMFWAVIATSGLAWRWDIDLPIWIMILMIFSMTALMLLAFLRVMLHLHKLIGKQVWVPIAAGLVFPIAGLLLNMTIPFPVDLQDWRVYAFTVVNAIALCIPFVGRHTRPWIWFARAATYPFTLYFFILFLPFLPLSIPAMVAVGSGFLILAPTLLFVVHTRRLLAEGRILKKRFGTLPILALFLIAFSLMPAGYLIRAQLHKRALADAIDAVYHPDYGQAESDIDIARARAALTRLHRMKEGVYAPLISEAYDSIVFDGMVLPDHKMEHMETVLFGAPIDFDKTGRNFEFFSFIGSSRNRRQNWSNVRPPARNVNIEDMTTTTSEQGALVETEVVLTMRNTASQQAEFVTTIAIPESVAVSGYWLDIEGERVPGRIFDRKTALWVFHMIRDVVRRDPGMVHYLDADTLELRVFPFESNQIRTCAVKFLYPRGLDPAIVFGGRQLNIAAPTSEPQLVFAGTDSAKGLLVPEGWEGMADIRRKPYLHILVDASEGRTDALPLVEEEIESLLKTHPEVETLKIDFVNYETTPVGDGYLDRESWRAAYKTVLPSIRPSGGFWPERAVNHAVIEHRRSEDLLESVPAFVLLANQVDDINADELLPTLAPDTIIATPVKLPQPLVTPGVHAFRCGDQTRFIAAGSSGMAIFRGTGAIESFGESTGWIPLEPDLTLLEESRYSQFINLRAIEQFMEGNPNIADAFRREILDVSRESGILSRHTAYIVVENSAQWEILKRKEKDAMRADGALEFDEFQENIQKPEPEVWLLICLTVPALIGRWIWTRPNKR